MNARALVIVILLAFPLVAAQGLPSTPADPLLAGAPQRAVESAQETSNMNLQREEVDIAMRMVFRTVDLDTINVVFGGGTFQAQARLSTRFEFYVISVGRVQQALDKVAPGQANLTAQYFDASHQFISADQFRATFAGEALQAFEDEQEARATEFISATLPNITVLSAQFTWSNTAPEEGYEGDPGDLPDIGDPQDVDGEIGGVNDPRLPPIVLETTFELQYVERTSLLTIVENAWEDRGKDDERKEAVADKAAAYERGAFSMLGITQVLDLHMPPGWNLDLSVVLPEGYTFEEASPDVALADDHRFATASTLARDAEGFVANPVALTFSNRFVVSMALLSVVLLLGAMLRFPVTLAWNAVRRRRSARTKTIEVA